MLRGHGAGPEVVVFHVPYPLQDAPVAASALRPKKMRAAFEEAGYRVIEVSGRAKARRRAIKRLLNDIDGGLEVSFVYSESATIPNSFTEPRHFPVHLQLDRRFFRQMKLRGIPVGVFYRDIYWMFPEYRRRVGSLVAGVMRVLYRWDLDAYTRYVRAVFVPSFPYWEHVVSELAQQGRRTPHRRGLARRARRMTAVELRPAAEFSDLPVKPWRAGESLQILYVGGVDLHLYDPSQLIRAVESVPDVSLTLCVPEKAWRSFEARTDLDLSPRVEVVHVRGEELEPYYERAHLCSLYLPPEEYRDFAVPMKLYEYLAHSRPVFATEGSLAATFVAAEGLGWQVPFSEGALRGFFDELREDRVLLEQKGHAARDFAVLDSWKHRALEAARALTR